MIGIIDLPVGSLYHPWAEGPLSLFLSGVHDSFPLIEKVFSPKYFHHAKLATWKKH
jgi:hypothetical protein